MKSLTQADRKEIAAYDARQQRRANLSRFYKYLIRNGDDLEIHTIAVKSRKDGTAAVKEVIRASATSNRVMIKDVVFHYIAGYQVDWSPENLGHKHDWTYEGQWGITTYDPKRSLWKLRADIVNPEEILKSPRFKWCAYRPDCGDILDYLKTYARHPRIELLSKAGVGRLARSASFLQSIDRNPHLARFVIDNVKAIATSQATIPTIRAAFAQGTPIAEAQRRIDNKRFLRDNRLPGNLDAERVLAYIERQHIHARQYSDYIDDCRTARLELTDTKNAFPTNFERRAEALAARAASIRRRDNAAMRKRLNARIRAVAKMLRQAETASGPFAVRFPRNELDLIREGKALDHCVGDGCYAKQIADGGTIIAFIRKPDCPDTPFVTVAFSTTAKRVTACYGIHNSLPPPEVNAFVKGPFEQVLAKQAS